MISHIGRGRFEIDVDADLEFEGMDLGHALDGVDEEAIHHRVDQQRLVYQERVRAQLAQQRAMMEQQIVRQREALAQRVRPGLPHPPQPPNPNAQAMAQNRMIGAGFGAEWHRPQAVPPAELAQDRIARFNRLVGAAAVIAGGGGGGGGGGARLPGAFGAAAPHRFDPYPDPFVARPQVAPWYANPPYAPPRAQAPQPMAPVFPNNNHIFDDLFPELAQEEIYGVRAQRHGQ